MPTDPREGLTDEQANEAERLAQLKRMRELHEAFENVFGRPGSRTVEQTRVLEYLAKYVGNAREGIKFDGAGAVDPYRTIASVGQRAMLAEIWHRINWQEGVSSNVDTSG